MSSVCWWERGCEWRTPIHHSLEKSGRVPSSIPARDCPRPAPHHPERPRRVAPARSPSPSSSPACPVSTSTTTKPPPPPPAEPARSTVEASGRWQGCYPAAAAATRRRWALPHRRLPPPPRGRGRRAHHHLLRLRLRNPWQRQRAQRNAKREVVGGVVHWWGVEATRQQRVKGAFIFFGGVGETGERPTAREKGGRWPYLAVTVCARVYGGCG